MSSREGRPSGSGALAADARILILDEPVSVLDVSAQVLNLLEDLKNEFGLTYLFMGYDHSVFRL